MQGHFLKFTSSSMLSLTVPKLFTELCKRAFWHAAPSVGYLLQLNLKLQKTLSGNLNHCSRNGMLSPLAAIWENVRIGMFSCNLIASDYSYLCILTLSDQPCCF